MGLPKTAWFRFFRTCLSVKISSVAEKFALQQHWYGCIVRFRGGFNLLYKMQGYILYDDR